VLITEKHQKYTKDKTLGGNIRRVQLASIVLFALTLFGGIIIFSFDKDIRHLFWFLPLLITSCAAFASPGRLIHPKCGKCGFRTVIDTCDITPDAFLSKFGFSTETAVYKGSLYTRVHAQENAASKEDTAALVTQDYYICHTCHTYAPTFNKNYKQTAKNFEALKELQKKSKSLSSRH